MKKLLLLFIILFSSPALSANNQPIEITADKALEWNQETKTYTARGNAMVKQGDITLKTENLTAFYAGENGSTSDIIKITAEGGVVITTPTATATADKALYTPATTIAELMGHVEIKQGVNRLTGDKAEMNMTTRISKMTNTQNAGRVKAVFYTGK